VIVHQHFGDSNQFRILQLQQGLQSAVVVSPPVGSDNQVRFGATVTVRGQDGEERTISIVGVDEIDTSRGYVSWVSPIARALIKAREGDIVTLRTPGGTEELEILAVRYQPLATN